MTAARQSFACPGCGQLSTLPGSRVIAGKRICASCGAAGRLPQVAPRPASTDAPPAVRVTQCPGYSGDQRFMVAEAPPLFSALGVGRYLGEGT